MATLEKPLKIKEFAEAINVSEDIARCMVHSEVFAKNKIAVNIACKGVVPPRKRGTGRRNKKMRIYMSRYLAAVEKGLLAP